MIVIVIICVFPKGSNLVLLHTLRIGIIEHPVGIAQEIVGAAVGSVVFIQELITDLQES